MKLSFAPTGYTALCFATLLAAQILFAAPVSTPHKMHPDFKAPTVPPTLQQLRDPKYRAEQKREVEALTNNAWIHQPWTGDDAPYAAARAKIDREIGTLPPQAVVGQYAAPAKLRPQDSLAQFAWAYAVCKAVHLASFAGPQTETTRFAAELAISEAPFPRTYNYARLHYLITLQGTPGSHYLKGLAYRLLQKDPSDYAVLTGLISLDSLNNDKASQKEGYALIQKLIKKSPDKPEVYDMLGAWYYFQYLSYEHKPDYQAAMTNYRKALAMYPATAARKAALPQVMAFLTTRYHQISGS